MKANLRHDTKRLFILLIGASLYALNIVSFVRTAGLFPAGFGGLTLLIQEIMDRFFHIAVPYTAISLLLNLGPAIISFKLVGKRFTILSCLSLLLTSTLTDVLSPIVLTTEPMLLCIFGGVINGFAASLCLGVGASNGGSDFITISLSERYNRDSFNLTLDCNVVILSIAGILFSWERALYSIIFQFVSTQTLHILYKRYQKQTLMIITNMPEEVYGVIRSIAHHSATEFKGTGLYEHKERSMIYTVIASDEIKPVIDGVRKVDPHAFINSIKTHALTGSFYKRPNV